MKNLSNIVIAGSKILSVLLLAFINFQVMAQSDYKKVNEAKGLQVGESVKNFSALDLHDSTFTLSEALKKGPVVVIFYRGQWCPICNKHLSHLQDSLQLIYDKGASVVAISPETSEFLKRTAEKTNAAFSLLYDDGYKIADLFDVTFMPNSATTAMYNTILGANLKEANTDDSQRLPIPATFIIGTDGKILWRHFNPDYKKRSTVTDIVNNLPEKHLQNIFHFFVWLLKPLDNLSKQ
ncbi:MAG: AhpC/TSA family protein [Bacteroidales bacterium]|nr:AhpC/TSA family protein [Bacteroidales bacterium]